jgi:hypothetical protein
LQVDRGGSEIRVAELPLDDVEPHALTGHSTACTVGVGAPRIAALTAADENAAARAVKVTLGQSERFADPQACASKDDDERPGPQAVRRVASLSHDGDNSSTAGGSAAYRRPLLRGGRPQWKPAMVAGDGRQRRERLDRS